VFIRGFERGGAKASKLLIVNPMWAIFYFKGVKMFYLYEYTDYPISKYCKKISKNRSAKKLMEETKDKGHKFFINHSSGGTYYHKSISYSEKWDILNRAVPIKPFTI
jgi:hypothetical protein